MVDGKLKLSVNGLEYGDKRIKKENHFYVYILRCADNTLYTGWTINLAVRVARHNIGKGAKYTRARLPVTLVYYEECEDEKSARRREFAIKRLTRAEKLNLVG
ncbi:GIY-YIG nuclease family protein [Candidatus Chlorohelix sp.]|uniref:GIY-YIG nuclease family protein n=1 Tax=Candidatus Chlorohelix sp. TaxID=3139201 RepID=UPI00307292C4